jgi:diguanylate cyclase (GGDEF)-like protein
LIANCSIVGLVITDAVSLFLHAFSTASRESQAIHDQSNELTRAKRLADTCQYLNHNFNCEAAATNCYDYSAKFSAIGRGKIAEKPIIFAGAGMMFFGSVKKMPIAARPADALRRLAASVASIQVFVLVVLVAVIVAASVVMNRSAFTAQSELIDNSISKAVTDIIDEQKSVAFWDESAKRFAPSHIDKEWANVEIGRFLTETYGHRELYILSPNNKPVYAFVDGKPAEPATYIHRAVLIEPLVKDIRYGGQTNSANSRKKSFREFVKISLSLSPKTEFATGTIITIDGVPSIMSVIVISPNVNMSLVQKTPYLLVSIVPITQATFDRIGGSLLIHDLKLVPVVNGKAKYNIKPLFADDGSMPAELVWTAPAPGRMLLTTILPLVLLASIIAGIFVRSLLARLMKASADLVAREASAVHQSLHDSLSGLPNRSSFLEHSAMALKASDEDGLHNMVAYVDIDHFKDINDTLGHGIGDDLIVQVGKALRQALPPTDHVARLGGDEFAILRRAPFASDAAALGQDILQALTKIYDLQGQMTKVNVSVGVASSASASTSAEMLLRYADIALYDAKDNGRNKVSHFAEAMALSLEDRYALESDLRDAVVAGDVYMLYQPIINVQSQLITGVEALVRWRHPVRGIVSPADFIPLAEKSGLMPALGALIFKKVFADAARWPSLEMSVNLSPAQMRDSNLVPMIQGLQQQFGIKAAQIVFEITEGVLLEATDHALETLDQLTTLGFKIALDDFGTGYSSLSYLRQFEFHKLKIDRSFVQDVVTKQNSMWIVQAIVALGTGLGMCVVAEGIETEAEADVMCNAGCNELQGYYFSKPIESAAIDVFFEDQSAIADKKTMPL